MAKSNFKGKYRRGDIQLICEMTGYKMTTVWQQLNGQRTLKDKVKVAIEKIIESRNLLLKNK